MGSVSCCANENENQARNTVKDSDLPAPNPSLFSDKYSRFEVTLPFCRIKLNDFVKNIDLAEKISGK